MMTFRLTIAYFLSDFLELIYNNFITDYMQCFAVGYERRNKWSSYNA